MSRAKPNPLRAVDKVPKPALNFDYEHEQRKQIMSRDWGQVHITAHKRKPFAFFSRRP